MAAASVAHVSSNDQAFRTPGPSPPQTYYPNQGAMPNTPPSANISPTNLHSHLHVRQLRPPKQPLYTPACLRPTEPASTRPKDIPGGPRAPDTPPQSKDNSFDSGKSQTTFIETAGLPLLASPDEGDLEFMLRQGLSRSASDSLDEPLGDVTGPPTVAHWKPDESAICCTICASTFTWFFRRHHCRRCGDVVCANHISRSVPLDQNARYHPSGTSSKACDNCHREWSMIQRLRHSRTSSIADSQSSSQGTLYGGSTTKPPMAIPQHVRQDSTMQVGSMARSEGMVWSTF